MKTSAPKTGPKLFQEDDVRYAGWESIYDAYQRLFNVSYLSTPRTLIADCGDNFWYETEHAIIHVCFDGSTIYEKAK